MTTIRSIHENGVYRSRFLDATMTAAAMQLDLAVYTRATNRFIEIARDFQRRVDADEEDLEIEQRFRKRRGFYFTSLMTLTGRHPGAGLVDVLRTSNDGALSSARLLQVLQACPHPS